MHSLKTCPLYIVLTFFKNLPQVASKSGLRHMAAKLLLGLPLQLSKALWGMYWINISLILISDSHDNGNIYLWRYSLSMIYTEITPVSIDGSQTNILGYCAIFSFARKNTYEKWLLPHDPQKAGIELLIIWQKIE